MNASRCDTERHLWAVFALGCVHSEDGGDNATDRLGIAWPVLKDIWFCDRNRGLRSARHSHQCLRDLTTGCGEPDSIGASFSGRLDARQGWDHGSILPEDASDTGTYALLEIRTDD
jgi:hypothetical protein